MVGAGFGRGMTSVNQTRRHCVNQMGKTHSKPLAARHGRGTAWARHECGMLCVNRPLEGHCHWGVPPRVLGRRIWRLNTHCRWMYSVDWTGYVLTAGFGEQFFISVKCISFPTEK